MTTVWSYGGGVQSVAMGILITQRQLPFPDLAVIADTGREASSTWSYLETVFQPWLSRLFSVRIDRAPHTLATVGLYGKNGDLLIPAFTGEGKLPTFCSNEWKRRVVARWLRKQGVKACDLWLGISLDEIHRMRTGAEPKWMRNRYPLVDLRLTRADCVAVIERAGLPMPEKSACWMCPHRTNAEWRVLRDRHPSDFMKAVALEETIRVNDKEQALYLHRARRPLATVDLDEPETGQTDLFCESGFCWT